MNKLSQRGLTLFEASISLVIIGVAAAGLAILAASAIQKSKISKTYDAIQTIQKTVIKLYANRPGFDGVTSAVLADSGLLPDSMVDPSSSTLQTPFGAVEVGEAGWFCAGCTYKNAFSLRITGLPSQACTELGIADYGDHAVVTRVSPGSSMIPSQTGDDVPAVAAMCSVEDTGTVMIIFTQ